MLKIIKEKNKFLRYFNETFKLSSGFERFLASILIMLMICHLTACFWYMMNDFFEDSESWVYAFNFVDSSNLDVNIK